MKSCSTYFSFLLILAVSPILAQKYSNEFLSIGVGARAQGMSGAMTALSDDVTSGYWNPAGLSHITSPVQVAAMHAEWFVGVSQYDYLSFGRQLSREKSSYLAFSLVRFGVDQIPYTINLIDPDGTVNYDNVTPFSAADYALMGSYGRKLKNPDWSVGGTVKVVRRVIGSFGGSWGFGADLGLQYRHGPWRLGLMGRDLTTTFNAWSFTLNQREKEVYTSTNNEIPVSNTEITRPQFTLGAAFDWKINQKTSLRPALDAIFTTDGQRNVAISSKSINVDPRFGLEADYNSFVQLRLGVGNFQKVKDDFNPTKENWIFQPNFGVGLKLGRLQLDYALTDIGNVSQVLYSHIFSVRLDFKERKKTVQTP